MTPLKSAFKFLCCVVLATLLSSCARTFTSRTSILTMRITMTFAGPVNLEKYNYLLIFSENSGISLPPNTAPFIYFPTPGRTFNTDYLMTHYGGLSEYYANYYTTWSDYMMFSKTGPSVYQASGDSFIAPTTVIDGVEVVATDNFFFAPTAGFTPDISINGNTLTITFQLQQLDTDAQFLYLQLATVERNFNSSQEGFAAGEFRDRLTAPVGISIDQNNNQTIPDSDSTDPLLMNTGSDIRSCRIEIL